METFIFFLYFFFKNKDEITFKNANDFKYLEACLLETLRLHPSAPWLVRFAKHDIKLANTSYVIKKGEVLYCVVT